MNITNISNLPLLGVGMGYRDELCDNIFNNTQYIDFLEITMDHFITKNKKEWTLDEWNSMLRNISSSELTVREWMDQCKT